MCFRCSTEPSHLDCSFEYPQHMFWLRNKKIICLVHTLNKNNFKNALLSGGLIIWRPDECEVGIKKSVPHDHRLSSLGITICHHEACRVMTNGDPEGRIFLSHPHTNNGFLSCAPFNAVVLH